MCGRYTLSQVVLVNMYYDVLSEIELMPSFNVAPGQVMPVIVNGTPYALKMMKWGLVPSWAKEPGIGSRMINARAETVAEKPAFRHSFRRRRCLVPATGYYEWKHEGSRKTPMYMRLKDRDLFAFAGLYDHWRDENGATVATYTIITTQPNELVGAVHDRMPVILRREDEAEWLDPQAMDAHRLERLLVAYPGAEMEAWQVSDRVNSPKNNSPDLMDPGGTLNLFP